MTKKGIDLKYTGEIKTEVYLDGDLVGNVSMDSDGLLHIWFQNEATSYVGNESGFRKIDDSVRAINLAIISLNDAYQKLTPRDEKGNYVSRKARL